eukprot:COSAG06_NODE_1139_length_10559_cov_2.704493_1_plen_716_part_10
MAATAAGEEDEVPLALRCVNRMHAASASAEPSPRGSACSTPPGARSASTAPSSPSCASSSDDFDPTLDCSDSQTEAAASWSQGGSASKSKGAASRRASGGSGSGGGDGAVFSSAHNNHASSDEDIFARRRQQQLEQASTAVAAEEASDGGAVDDPALTEQDVERHLKELLHAFVRSQWALFETQTNLHVQLRNCATQLTTSADARPKLPAQLIDETSQQTTKVEELRRQIEERGTALQSARQRREASLREEMATRQVQLDELAWRLAEEQRAQQCAAQELEKLERQRLACEEGEPAITELRSELQAAEDEVATLSSQSDQLLHSHCEVVKVRQEQVMYSAAERSQRETAALHLLLGQAQEAQQALFELESTTAANAEAMRGQTDPEARALQLLAEAQLRQWSDAAFPVVSKRTNLIRRQAEICWGIQLEEDVASHTPRPFAATPAQTPPAASKLRTPPFMPSTLKSEGKVKIEQGTGESALQTMADARTPPAPAATAACAVDNEPQSTSTEVDSSRDSLNTSDATATTTLPPMLPSSMAMAVTPVRNAAGSTGTQLPKSTPPPSTGKRRRNAPYTADDDLALLQYVSEHGTTGAQGDTYWSRAVDANLLQSSDLEKPSRTANSLRERWRKILRPRYEAAGGNVAVAVAAQHAAAATAAAAAGKGSASGARRNSLDGGRGQAGAAATPQRQGGSSGRRQQVPKAVANALWRRDCGES